MIRLLNGVIDADEGTMSVGGLDPLKDGDRIRLMSGIVTESAGLYDDMSAIDNLQFFATLYGVSDPARADELLEYFGLKEHRNKPVGTFSTGMKKRLALAKALVHRPQLLFLDEPTNGLDPEGIRLVLQFIKQLNEQEGTTVFMCSHVLHQMESICSSYIFMERGRVLASGTQADIEARYMTQVTVLIETGAIPQGGSYAGYPAERVDARRLRFRLPSKADISDLLRTLLADSWVNTVHIENRDLESLYFQVRKEHA